MNHKSWGRYIPNIYPVHRYKPNPGSIVTTTQETGRGPRLGSFKFGIKGLGSKSLSVQGSGECVAPT